MSEEAQCEHELYGERCRLIKGHSGLHDREFGLVPAERAPEPTPSGAADEVKECFTCEGENGLPATTAVFICNACAGEERALMSAEDLEDAIANALVTLDMCNVPAANWLRTAAASQAALTGADEIVEACAALFDDNDTLSGGSIKFQIRTPAALIEKLEGLATFWESEGKRCYDIAHERGRTEPDRSIMAQSVRFWECARELRETLRSTPASTGAKG